MNNEDLLPLEFRSATTLLSLLRARKLGALELLDLQLARIGRTNPALNAVVSMDVERARSAARAADSAGLAGCGPLHGVPITIKDAYEVVGMPATCGFPHLAKHVPARDADAVARLRAAGAIPFAADFLSAGTYRLFLQFKIDEVVHTAGFTVEVAP